MPRFREQPSHLETDCHAPDRVPRRPRSRQHHPVRRRRRDLGQRPLRQERRQAPQGPRALPEGRHPRRTQHHRSYPHPRRGPDEPVEPRPEPGHPRVGRKERLRGVRTRPYPQLRRRGVPQQALSRSTARALPIVTRYARATLVRPWRACVCACARRPQVPVRAFRRLIAPESSAVPTSPKRRVEHPVSGDNGLSSPLTMCTRGTAVTHRQCHREIRRRDEPVRARPGLSAQDGASHESPPLPIRLSRAWLTSGAVEGF